MSKENNLKDSEKQDQNLIVKGWKNFIDGAKDGFDNFKASLEKQTKKGEEVWEENKEKVDGFFNKIKQDWDSKIKQWNTEMEQRSLETKEQLEASKSKIQQEIKNWQDNTKQEWNDGVKSFRRGFFKAYLWALIIILPMVVIIVVILAVVSRLLG
ncbi:MAG: hypothetical protein KAW51_07145 [Candidatus Lokiarchaeota archaeon]|nr:hypothetical protein [Candidatus Lokiarchaeota archaeon]